MDNYVVVGDNFKNFVENKNYIFTVSDFQKKIWSRKIGNIKRLTFGQGVDYATALTIQSTLKTIFGNSAPYISNIDILSCLINPALKKSVHKEKHENLLITKPNRVGESQFISQVIIHNHNEFLHDHATGEHIQGMILTEASRQILLSVSEYYILDEKEQYKMAFILNNIEIKFHQFSFPLPMSLEFNITELIYGEKNSIKVTAASKFFQNGKLIAEVNTNYSAYQKYFINNKEKYLSLDAVHVFFEIQESI